MGDRKDVEVKLCKGQRKSIVASGQERRFFFPNIEKIRAIFNEIGRKPVKRVQLKIQEQR